MGSGLHSVDLGNWEHVAVKQFLDSRVFMVQFDVHIIFFTNILLLTNFIDRKSVV